MSVWPWKNFAPEEVLSPSSLHMLKTRNNLKVQGFAMDYLQRYREHLGLPLSCNHAHLKLRGHRTEKENALTTVKGVPDSPHVQGIAFDLSCYKLKLIDFFISSIKFGWPCVIIYPTKNFCHHDKRTILGDYQIIQNDSNKKTYILSRKERELSFETLKALVIQKLEIKLS